jgi:iron complex transport system substrate-binding protein
VKPSNEIEELARAVIDCGYHIHVEFGPGLFESVYEAVLEHRLARSGLAVERQKAVAVKTDGLLLPDAFRIDLLVGGKLIVEIKCAERLLTIHNMQLLTYLRLTNLPLGLLVNFGQETFKSGVKRIINNHAE